MWHIRHFAVKNVAEMRTGTSDESGCFSQIENSGNRSWIHKPLPPGLPGTGIRASPLFRSCTLGLAIFHLDR